MVSCGFGIATIVFGVSRVYWLSLLALVVLGALDNISVVIRSTLLQILAPDAMRGRVDAVNSVFVGTSNEIGELESGIAAQMGRFLFGPVIGPIVAVAGGGAITTFTTLVVVFVAVRWPVVRRLRTLSI